MSQPRSEDSKAFKKVSFEFGKYSLRYAWVSQRGYYPEDLDKHNQDAHLEVETFGKDKGIDDCAYFAVYDGHGKTGDLCSIFTRDRMPKMLAEEIAKDHTAIDKAHNTTFVKINELLHQCAEIDDSMSGTTASTLHPKLC